MVRVAESEKVNFFAEIMYCKDHHLSITPLLCFKTSCPSGLRSHVKAVVLIGAGSNPADVIFCLLLPLQTVLNCREVSYMYAV